MGAFEQLSPKLTQFLAEPNVGVLATVRRDGSPHLTAVWYLIDSDEIRVAITTDRAKYRHVLRDPRVSLCIASTDLPYKLVTLEGRARIEEEGGHELMEELSICYYGEEEGRAYAAYSRDVVKEDRVVLTFRPENVMSWDFEVEDDHHKPWLEGYPRIEQSH